MNRAIRWAAAAAVLATLMGADKCERKPRVDYTGFMGAVGCEHGKERWVKLQVTEAKMNTGGHAPYTVELSAETVNAEEPLKAHFGPKEYAGKPYWFEEMCYTSGVKVNIKLVVSGHRSDTFGCSVFELTPAGVITNSKNVAGKNRRATCEITTVQ